jgi:HEAT repeat protein
MNVRVTKKRVLIGLAAFLGVLLLLGEIYLLSPGARIACIGGLERAGAWSTLVGMLADSDWSVKKAAFDALVRGGPAAVPALIPALDGTDAVQRMMAATALGQIGPPALEAVLALKTRMQTEDHEGARAEAAMALGLIGRDNPDILADLMRMLESGDEASRIGAAEALQKVGEQASQAVRLLGRALHDKNPRVREEAAEALGGLGGHAKPVIPALIEALGDSRPRVRREVQEALHRILMTLTDEDAPLRDQVKAALEKPPAKTSSPDAKAKP